MQYYFILGKNPILSKAEIEAVFELESIKYKLEKFQDKILILETSKDLDIELLNRRLGGTVKIGKILGHISDLHEVESKFFNLIKVKEGKLHFGFSLYPLAEKVNIKKKLQKLRPIAMEIKRILREEKNLNSRWVVSKEPELSSVIVKKNQLLKYGSEICFFIAENDILVGQTLAVQLFEEFGERDFNRPGRDAVSGMLPPKLARIMINLAQADKKSLILDPFCGSGTVLQEALLMDYNNLIGFDNSEKAINDTQINLNWLKEKYEVDIEKIKIKQVDAIDLSKNLSAESIDFIITEPYLGPPLKGNETKAQIEKNIQELETLYLKVFEQFTKVLKYKGKVVMVIPEFKYKNENLKLNLYNIKGFKIINKERLEYSRPNQHVIRNIIIFQKNG
jgi:tRNA G10  N-methylase Trm11